MMEMQSLNLPQDIEQNLAFLARETGRDKDDLVQEAIYRGIEDLIEEMKDIRDAKKVLASSSRQWTLEEVEAKLDLEGHI
ncbi:type II toxin-antitoxin system RelB family antitoxin [Crocosphaera sp.]|uniref:type II toxin-antitoxin system RelB family antitoxin n=1 Tax=Crocosphaera sp. TaxID=2729996 RepID=UPI003F20EA24